MKKKQSGEKKKVGILIGILLMAPIPLVYAYWDEVVSFMKTIQVMDAAMIGVPILLLCAIFLGVFLKMKKGSRAVFNIKNETQNKKEQKASFKILCQEKFYAYCLLKEQNESLNKPSKMVLIKSILYYLAWTSLAAVVVALVIDKNVLVAEIILSLIVMGIAISKIFYSQSKLSKVIWVIAVLFSVGSTYFNGNSLYIEASNHRLRSDIMVYLISNTPLWLDDLGFDGGDVREYTTVAKSFNIENPLPLTIEGDYFARRGKTQLAGLAYREALKRNGNQSQVFYKLALVEKKSGNRDEALLLLKRSQLLKKEYPQLYLERANIFDEIGKYKEALTEIETAIIMEPLSSQAYYLKGATLEKMKEYDLALTALNHCLSIDIKNVKAYILRSQVLIHLGKSKSAFESIKKGISFDSHSSDSYSIKGQIQMMNGQIDQALESFNKSMALAPGNKETTSAVVLCYVRLGKIKEANELLKSFVITGTDSTGCLLNYATAMLETYDYGKAIDAIDLCVARDPFDISIKVKRAEILVRAKELSRAQTEFAKIEGDEKVLESEEYQMARGLFKFYMEDYKEAQISFEKASSLSSKNAKAMMWYALATNYLGDRWLSDKLLENALLQKVDLGEAYYAKSVMLYERKLYRLAQDAVNKALEFAPLHIDAKLMKVRILEELDIQQAEAELTKSFQAQNFAWAMEKARLMGQKGMKEALDEANRAVSINSDNFEGYVVRAEILMKLGKNSEAILDAQRAIEKNPLSYSARLVKYLATNPISPVNIKGKIVANDPQLSSDAAAAIVAANEKFIQGYYSYAIAMLSFGEKDYDKAVEMLKKALLLEDNYRLNSVKKSDVYKSLSDVYTMMKKPEDAVKALEMSSRASKLEAMQIMY